MLAIEMVSMLSRDYAYTLEEIAKICKVRHDKCKELIQEALTSNLLDFMDRKMKRNLTEKTMQVKTVRYYKRIW